MCLCPWASYFGKTGRSFRNAFGGLARPLDVVDDEDIILRVGNKDLPVRLTTHPRARRLSLRVDPALGCILLVRPKSVSKSAAVAFSIDKADWIAKSLAELSPPIPFKDGNVIPILNKPHRLCHLPEARRGVWREDNCLFVSGDPRHIARRVKDWFREEARRMISPMAYTLASDINKKITHIAIRDTKSRWGSCTTNGRVSFSWRLVMTPDYVLNYVVAHEIAHLCELNHSKAFWKTVDSLTAHRPAATQWLKQKGAEMHRYGLVTRNEQE